MFEPAKQGKPKGSVLDAHADFILEALKADARPDPRTRWSSGLPLSATCGWSETAVWKFLDRHDQDV